MKKNEEYLKIDNKIKYFLFVCILYCLIPFSYLLYRRKNNWLVCERGTDAQDNGFFFYKFLVDKHPDINAIYVITRDSIFFNKIKQVGKFVYFGSFKHFLMVIAFPVKISTHLYGYSPFKNYSLYLRRHKTKDTHVFLQHGITKNNLPGLYENVTHLDLFVCGAKPEYDYISDNFMYENNQVQYTGFPRFDDLNDESQKKQILIMPTWRRSLVNLSKSDFLNTDFYKNWNNVLNSKIVREKCMQHSLIIKFYLHYSLRNYINDFTKNDFVKFVFFEEQEVHDLLKESKLLITDFSSVFFDMAYMLKPIIFFQFDEKEYNETHYEKGYFDYHSCGFGPVCADLKSLEEAFSNMVDKQFCIDDQTKKVFENFFPVKDANNCNRVFEAIKKARNKRKNGKN